MNVRVANIDDLGSLIPFANEWIVYQLTCSGFVFDEAVFKEHLKILIKSKNCMVIEMDGKIIGGVAGRIVKSWYTKDIIFDVMTMYIDEEFRHLTDKIFASLEVILSMTSVTKLVVASPFFQHAPKINRYYKMRGYRGLQTSFIKDIKHEVQK